MSKFRLAFAFEGLNNKTLKDDERYVRYVVRHYGKIDGKNFQRLLPIHRCTALETSEFFPISSDNANSFKRRIKDGVFEGFCIDWDKDLNISG